MLTIFLDFSFKLILTKIEITLLFQLFYNFFTKGKKTQCLYNIFNFNLTMVKEIDKILLFICGDSIKLKMISSLEKKKIAREKNKRKKLTKEEKKEEKILQELWDSLKYPFPISAKIISQALNYDRTGTLLRKLESQGLLTQNKRLWELKKGYKVLSNLYERFRNKDLLERFIDTQLILEEIIHDFDKTVDNIFGHIPLLKISNERIEPLFDNILFNSLDLQDSPLFTIKLAEKIKEEEIEKIFKYTMNVVFERMNYEKYWYREIVFSAVMHYFQLTYNKTISKESYQAQAIMTRSRILNYIYVLDSSKGTKKNSKKSRVKVLR